MYKVDVHVKTDPYPVYIGQNILSSIKEVMPRSKKMEQIAVISNEKVYALYGDQLMDALPAEADRISISVPDGEKAKTLAQVNAIYTELLENRFERGCLIIALGGGVVGDLAGFVAATYLRGVSFIQIPTTLLAQVDSSIGGKVGVNHSMGKNLIGAFKQPLFVISDIRMLNTLPSDEIRCGLGEVIKYGFIRDAALFVYLEENLDQALDGNPVVLEELVRRSSVIKADIVARDEKEQNLRQILNFGHTFGHALEAELDYGGIKHGEAVILGMRCALEYLRLTRVVDTEFYDRGLRLLKRVPISFDFSMVNPERLFKRMTLDKKVKQKQIRLVLVDKIGNYLIEPLKNAEALNRAWNILKE